MCQGEPRRVVATVPLQDWNGMYATMVVRGHGSLVLKAELVELIFS